MTTEQEEQATIAILNPQVTKNKKRAWTLEEDRILTETCQPGQYINWPRIQEQLAHRTMHAIITRKFVLGIKDKNRPRIRKQQEEIPTTQTGEETTEATQ